MYVYIPNFFFVHDDRKNLSDIKLIVVATIRELMRLISFPRNILLAKRLRFDYVKNNLLFVHIRIRKKYLTADWFFLTKAFLNILL